MHSCKKALVCIAVIVLSMTGMAAGEERTCEQSPLIQALATTNNVFALTIYSQLRAADGNIFFSPYSIRTALAMTYAGARGETAAQMKNALGFTLDGSALHEALAGTIGALNTGGGADYEMSVANSLWGDRSVQFLQPFFDVNKKFYNAGLERVDFKNETESARQRINAWVEEKTHEKIANLMAPGSLSADSRLVLVNAVYFKGLWKEQFEKKLTRNEPFQCTGGRTAEAALMTFNGVKSLPFYREEGLSIIEFGYRGDNISMLVLLPDSPDGLAAVEEKLDGAALSRWATGLARRDVRVFLPRFTMSWGAADITPSLQALGMRDAFDGSQADFSGIDGTRSLSISGVFHKAFVDVNEEGTEAAAATGITVGVTSMPQEPEVFRADHPFLFMIREKATGAILFMGRLTEPEKN